MAAKCSRSVLMRRAVGQGNAHKCSHLPAAHFYGFLCEYVCNQIVVRSGDPRGLSKSKQKKAFPMRQPGTYITHLASCPN